MLHRRFDKFFGAVARGGVEEQRVAWFQEMASVTVAITYFTRKHINEFDTRVPELRIRYGIAPKRDQIGLNANFTGQRVAEKII